MSDSDLPLLLDACVALNLLVAGLLADVAAVEPGGFGMLAAAAAEVPGLDLAAVTVHELTEAELELFVELARNVDDGEAATLAAAHVRGWTMATDDRKACRVADALGLPKPVTTSRLLHRWSRDAGPPVQRVREILLIIEQQARFRPPSDDDDYQWWRSIIGLTT